MSINDHQSLLFINEECREPRQTKITVEFEALFWSYKYLPLIAEKKAVIDIVQGI